jgi:hypothetical protein
MFGRHVGGEIGGRLVVGFALVAAAFHEEAVGQPRKDAMDGHRVGRAQPALVVVARDVEPGVQAGFDAPRGAVEPEPVEGAEPLGREAGEQGDGFGLLPVDFPAQPRALGGERKARLLGGEGAALDGAGFAPALVAFAAAGQRGARGAYFPRSGGWAGGGQRFREKATGGSGTSRSRFFCTVGWLPLTVKR